MIADLRRVVGTLLRDNWSRSDVAWPNRSYDPTDETPFIKVFILPGAAMTMEIGASNVLEREVGIISIEVNVPVNSGEAEMDSMLDELAGIFRRVAEQGASQERIQFRSPSFVELGIDGSWYQRSCDIPYQRDTVI